MATTLDLQSRALQYLPTVADAFVFDPASGELMFTAFANTDSSIGVTVTENNKMGGVGGQKLFSIISDRQVTVSLTTLDTRLEYWAVNLGEKVRVGDVDVQSDKENHIAVNGSITINHVPVDGKVWLETSCGYIEITGVTTTEVDLSGQGIVDECVNVLYVYATKARYVNIGTTNQPLIAKLVLSTPLYNNRVGRVGKVQYVFPSFQFSGSFTQTLTASDSGTIDLTGSPNSTSMGCGSGSLYGQVIEIMDDESMVCQPTKIYLSPNEAELSLGASETVTLQLFGTVGAELINDTQMLDISAANLSSDTVTVATVNATTGVVTPVAVGSAIITATYNNLTTTSQITVIA